MTEFKEQALESACCGCDEIISNKGEHVNLICLPKKADWEFPTMGNVVFDIPSVYATAIMCDDCLENDTDPEYAVRGEDLERVPVDELEDIVPMSERIGE